MLSHRHANVMFKKPELKERSLEGRCDKKRAIFNNFGKK